MIYHSGPLVKKNKNNFEILSAGPTTSMRMGIYLPKLIERYGIKLVLGKGGLDSSILAVFNRFGCAYISVIGGLGALIADKMKVENVYYLNEFGSSEAVWKLKVNGLPGIVTMDCNFNSLHDDIQNNSKNISKKILEKT